VQVLDYLKKLEIKGEELYVTVIMIAF